MTPYKIQNLVDEWVDFSKNFPYKSLNWLKLFSKKSDDLGQSLAQNRTDWNMNGSPISLEIGVCNGLLSNFPAAHPHRNQTWVSPLPWFCFLFL